ncbi:hypothetical protein [Comamonas sp. BIGb0124]|uniref:hypothetical protein n=1 Tax=Comamonas sp. BIGb0124 TaxID=2485130 RepID=UPI0011CD8B1A|nr:hypothetical protein [Comamonas sp. BIGb0124]
MDNKSGSGVPMNIRHPGRIDSAFWRFSGPREPWLTVLRDRMLPHRDGTPTAPTFAPPAPFPSSGSPPGIPAFFPDFARSRLKFATHPLLLALKGGEC